jgi:thiosulfate dehydrogenase [quinone] large subunit
MRKQISEINYSNWQVAALVIVRVLIGWHFLYEGLVKVINPNWSAASFLNAAQGPFANLFKSMASNSSVLDVINFCNQWGLVLIGLSLILGLLSRWACIGGMALLSMYYLSNPPLIGLDIAGMAEGSYLLVNKNLIELFTLLILFFFPTGHRIGLDRFLRRIY